jgi:hypothetical protein
MHLRALATAEKCFREGRAVWVVVDLKDAFCSVPVSRLLEVCKHYLPDDKLTAFLGTVLGGASMPGLRQGGPLSPLLLNLYLHHLLDMRWRDLYPKSPLLRYADDILVPCGTVKEAGVAYDGLKELLRPTGMRLKESRRQAVRNLTGGGAGADYMGFKIKKDGPDGLRYCLPPAAWDGLAEAFWLAQEGTNAPVRAVLALSGWLAARGPCYPTLDRDQACARIASIGRKAGFDDLPSRSKLNDLWQAAHATWCDVRASVLAAEETPVEQEVSR